MFLTQQRPKKTWNFGPKCLEKAVQIAPELQTCRGTRDIHPSQLLLRRSKKRTSMVQTHTIVGMRLDKTRMTSLVMMRNFLRSLGASEDQIVAVVACCSVNQISSTRSHNSRNSSLCVAIFVIFIPNITAIEQYWGAVKFRSWNA